MPEYVPFYTVVKEPGRQFLREFGSSEHMGNRDMDSGEFGREAQRQWSIYTECVRRSLGHAFYHQAPNGPHFVVSPIGERRFLKDSEEIERFYNELSAVEKQKIIAEKGPLAGLVRVVEQLSLGL